MLSRFVTTLHDSVSRPSFSTVFDMPVTQRLQSPSLRRKIVLLQRHLVVNIVT